MKLTLNREYAVRHLGVAALFAGLAGWFLYDAVFVYPYLPADGAHHTTVEFQYSFAALLATAAFCIAFRVWANRKRVVEWDDEKLWGPGAGDVETPFSEIVGVEDAQWARKGIIVFLVKDGRRIKLDAWHHAGVKELVAKILPAKAAADNGQAKN